jgi:hypothetical protein
MVFPSTEMCAPPLLAGEADSGRQFSRTGGGLDLLIRTQALVALDQEAD